MTDILYRPCRAYTLAGRPCRRMTQEEREFLYHGVYPCCSFHPRRWTDLTGPTRLRQNKRRARLSVSGAGKPVAGRPVSTAGASDVRRAAAVSAALKTWSIDKELG